MGYYRKKIIILGGDSMKFIDVSAWERAMHYEVFRNSVQPQYCVTFDVDVTNFLSYVKKR